ncbi:Ferroporti-1 [Chytridium lagenaria]|nr:Ferroporti-1 [Chytridium lagenaria]
MEPRDADEDDEHQALLQRRHRHPPGSSLLISAYFFHTVATRMDEWSVAVMLALIFPSSLFYISIHSLFQTFLSILFGPLIGSVIERIPRLRSVWICVAAQKLGIASGMTVLWLLHRLGAMTWTWGLFGFAVACSSAVRLANIGTVIVLERDWVVLMAAGESSILTELNTRLRFVISRAS